MTKAVLKIAKEIIYIFSVYMISDFTIKFYSCQEFIHIGKFFIILINFINAISGL